MQNQLKNREGTRDDIIETRDRDKSREKTEWTSEKRDETRDERREEENNKEEERVKILAIRQEFKREERRATREYRR